ncbi:MFS transporter [Falsiroseomonas oryzae]|uniref:MFS transporter n=1 Tax=Falsiroseomonas oryzae TaxID=2766473 RepID=UPI0022EBA07B|nr:MFS transporter [Roseomonas sp. MO-31]
MPSISPPIWLMALAAFTIGCGMRILDPLLPMLARDFGVGLGAVAPLIGGFALAYGLGQIASGPLGDALGKLRVGAISLALYAVTLLAATLAFDLGTLLGVRVLSGLTAAATIPLFMAHIADKVPYEHRQAAIGRFLTGMVMANLLAGPISGVVGELAGWRASFLVLGALSAAIALLFAVLLGPGWRAGGQGAGGAGLGGFVKILARPAGRRLMLAAAGDGLLLFGGAIPFVASLLIERFGLSAAEAGLVVAGFGLGALVYTRAAPWLVRRFGERGLVRWGGLGIATMLAVIGLAPAWWMVAAAQAVLGLLFFMLHGVLQARATEALPEARGTAVAFFAMSLFFGQSLGAVIFGTLIAEAGFAAGFLLAAGGVVGLAFAITARVLPPATPSG